MKPENVTCPECRGPMVSRLNSRTQQRFWGCKDFPRCKGTRDTDGLSSGERRTSTRPERYRFRVPDPNRDSLRVPGPGYIDTGDEDDDNPDAYWPSDKARGAE